MEADPLADVTLLTKPGTVWLVLKEGQALAGRALDRPTLGRQKGKANDEPDTFVPRPPLLRHPLGRLRTHREATARFLSVTEFSRDDHDSHESESTTRPRTPLDVGIAMGPGLGEVAPP